MKVCVLKVDDDKANLDELAAVAGRTVEGWEMPKHAEPGDLAVWYATDPRQTYVAWGWVAGIPEPGFRGVPAGTRVRSLACGLWNRRCHVWTLVLPAASTRTRTRSSRSRRLFPARWQVLFYGRSALTLSF